MTYGLTLKSERYYIDNVISCSQNYRYATVRTFISNYRFTVNYFFFKFYLCVESFRKKENDCTLCVYIYSKRQRGAYNIVHVNWSKDSFIQTIRFCVAKIIRGY